MGELSELVIIEKTGNKDLQSLVELRCQGTYFEKVASVGTALQKCSNLETLDLSRNEIKSLEGVHYCEKLQSLSLYYNQVEDANELRFLQTLQSLTNLDLRLNPITRVDADYRLKVIRMLPNLECLDDRPVTEHEHAAAHSHLHRSQSSEWTANNQTNGHGRGPLLVETGGHQKHQVSANSMHGGGRRAASSHEKRTRFYENGEVHEPQSDQFYHSATDDEYAPKRSDPRGELRHSNGNLYGYEEKRNGRTNSTRRPNDGLSTADEDSSSSSASDPRWFVDLMDMVDKYWNGTRSLHSNHHFKSAAQQLISRGLRVSAERGEGDQGKWLETVTRQQLQLDSVADLTANLGATNRALLRDIKKNLAK